MRFQYLRDPVFLFAVALAICNKWILKPAFPHNHFIQGSLTDTLCLPVWVPFMLWGMRRLKWRTDDSIPQWSEILIPLIFWSVVFEVWLPHVSLFGKFAPGDPMDVVAYATGGIFAFLIWKCQEALSSRALPAKM